MTACTCAECQRVDTQAIATAARALLVEQIIAKLQAELFETSGCTDEIERAWRTGWNARVTSLVKELRGEKP
jgi:hypothetical protein